MKRNTLILAIAGIAALVFVVYKILGHEPMIVPCQRPAEIADRVQFNFSTDASIESLGADLGRDFRISFPDTGDEDELERFASTASYRVCERVREIECDDLECLRQVLELQAQADERIRRAVEARRAAIAEAAQHACQARVQECVDLRIDAARTEGSRSQAGGARASAPGIGGGRNTKRATICVGLGPNESFESASTRRTSCHGGRCSVTAPVYDRANNRVCVDAKAWSESKAFGGGGSGQYVLEVQFTAEPDASEVRAFRAECQRELSCDY